MSEQQAFLRSESSETDECPFCHMGNPYPSTCKCAGWCGVEGCGAEPDNSEGREDDGEEEDDEPLFEGFRTID